MAIEFINIQPVNRKIQSFLIFHEIREQTRCVYNMLFFMAAFRCNLNQCSVSFGHTVCLSVKQKTIYWVEFFSWNRAHVFYALYFSAFACRIQFPATNCIKHHVLLICFVLFLVCKCVHSIRWFPFINESVNRLCVHL